MSTELHAARTPSPPPLPAAVAGTAHERREAIYQGMRARLEEVIEEHPHIRYALGMETPEIRKANEALARAVNSFISGYYPWRRQVRPFFDRAVSTYLRTADEIVMILNGIIAIALRRALRDHPYIDLSLDSERISRCSERFRQERDSLLRGDLDAAALHSAFYELVAAYADASTPEDLPLDAP